MKAQIKADLATAYWVLTKALPWGVGAYHIAKWVL